MKKKIYVSILFAGFIALALTPSAIGANTVKITDNINDVKKLDAAYTVIGENLTYPDADINEVSFIQTGKNVEIQLKLAEGGEFRPSSQNSYNILLYTTSPNIFYFIVYTGIEGELGNIDFEVLITDMGDNFYKSKDVSVEDNVLTFSFELGSSNERCMSLNALVQLVAGDNSYFDSVPDNLESPETGDIFKVQPMAGGPYEGKTGENIAFQGSLEEGAPSEYEWVWLIQDTGEYLYGQNPVHKFTLPDNYTGILYVYNDKGDFGYAPFEVNIAGSSTSTGGNADEGGSGSGLMMFAILIAIIVIAGVAVVVVVLRR